MFQVDVAKRNPVELFGKSEFGGKMTSLPFDFIVCEAQTHVPDRCLGVTLWKGDQIPFTLLGSLGIAG